MSFLHSEMYDCSQQCFEGSDGSDTGTEDSCHPSSRPLVLTAAAPASAELNNCVPPLLLTSIVSVTLCLTSACQLPKSAPFKSTGRCWN